MTNLEFLQEWYHQVWIEGDPDAVDRFFLPRTGAQGLMPDGQVGPEDFKALVPALRALVRNLDITVVRSLDFGEWIWAQINVRAAMADSMRQIDASGQVTVRIVDGKITEAYNCFDFLTFFEQAGLLPENAFLLLLSSEKLG